MTDSDKLELCPFCGGEVDPIGWLSKDWQGVEFRGPECNDCGATAYDVDKWNTRAPDKALRSIFKEVEQWLQAHDEMLRDHGFIEHANENLQPFITKLKQYKE